MSLTNTDRQRYGAALEQLEAEQNRRIAEKVATGELRREVLPPAVVGSAEDAAEVITAREARMAAALREGILLEPMTFPSGDGDNSEPITVIVTGVPRNREPNPLRESPESPESAPPSPGRYIPDR